MIDDSTFGRSHLLWFVWISTMVVVYCCNDKCTTTTWTTTTTSHWWKLLMILCGFLSLSSKRSFSFSTSYYIIFHQPRKSGRRFLVTRSKGANVEISPTNHQTTPINSFRRHFNPKLLQALQTQNITHPTPIQAHGIPLLQKGYDVMGSAQTGTGKTLFFGLPLCEHLIRNSLSQSTNSNQQKSPLRVLILNPTRELAMQTAEALQHLTEKMPTIQVALAIGGESSYQQQRKQLDKCNVLVATPGRLLQFIDQRSVSLQQISFVVVDEADRMLDLGFEPDLRRIAKMLQRQSKQSSKRRQTVLCSATFPLSVQRIASDFLQSNYYFIAVGRVGATQERIQQQLQWVDGYSFQQKKDLLISIIRNFHIDVDNDNQNKNGVIIFVNRKDDAEKERNRTLRDFKNGKISILVATDVAARGLDVDTIGLVVQWDAPKDVDTYVHRVGRTGRAGAAGKAVTLIDGKSLNLAPSLVEILIEARQDVPAWLWGMSYVTRARQLEEEDAIAAGGGDTYILDADPTTLSEDVNDGFTSQDFRSSAAAGTWGSERDTSYQGFDEDAYSSLDTVMTSTDEPSLPPTNLTMDAESSILSDANMTHKSNKLPDDATGVVDTSFRRQIPSKELGASLRQFLGSAKLGPKPNPKAYKDLSSQKGVKRGLRFEYLGMFPFDKVVDLLTSAQQTRMDRNTGNLPNVLMVAEKPSIAKAIADALSGPKGPRQKRGISRALPVYEFVSNDFMPSDADKATTKPMRCKVTVTSVVGHIFSLGFVQDENQTRVDPSEYFHMPVVKQEEESTSKLRVVDHLRALSSKADHLVCWLDCDSEGENIAYEVIGVTRKAFDEKAAQEASTKDPNMITSRRVHRARFSAITRDALRDAFQELTEPDPALSRSVDARQELDLRVGVALTRLLSWRCVGLARQKFSPSTRVISYGPCQTPTLSFCVDRAKEIEAFLPQDYVKVRVKVSSQEGGQNEILCLNWLPPAGSEVPSRSNRKRASQNDTTEYSYETSSTFDMSAANNMVHLASEPNSYATITNLNVVNERRSPPLGLNTVALLAAGSKTMGMSPKKVMQIAEKLYSSGFISYPRTETTRYDPKGFDVQSMLRMHTSHPEWGRTAFHLLRTKYAKSGRPPIRGYDAGDHPPITCLKSATREEVGGGVAWRVYEFVCRTFLASLSDELTYTRHVAELQLNNNKQHKFLLEKVNVESLGFAGACPWVLNDIGAPKRNKKGNDDLNLRRGMKLPIVEASADRCKTKPPGFLQEHELIELMDTNRIGTDASMAVHVNNVVDRGYVVLCDEKGVPLRPPRPPRPGQRPLPRQIGRYLVPTPLGIGLLDLFQETTGPRDSKVSPALLSQPAIRAQMENEVKQIALGEMEKLECVEQNLAWFEARYRALAKSLSKERLAEFGQSLTNTKNGLHYWQRLNAFEVSNPPQQNGKWNKRRQMVQGGRQNNKTPQRQHGALKRSKKRRKQTAKQA